MKMELENIKNSFLVEAKNSPILLNDLAEMEGYIAESYQGRSLIELLQNADDCNSTKFYIKKLGTNKFIIANNGRPFDKEDLISLCRSGSSTKYRKSGTIGFRGIGFKSVVNYATKVYLYSGEYHILFSKELTQSELNVDIKVPLIRIPHLDTEKSYEKIYDELRSENYTTMFVFETKNETIIDEIKAFNNNCLLFLNNICEVSFEYGLNKKITIDRNNKNIFKVHDSKETSEWMVLKNLSENDGTSIAFKLENNKAVPLDGSYIHSFMPTAEKINMPFIINSDFSTDPSRTKIIDDEETEKSINSVIRLLISIIKQSLDENSDNYGLINVIANYEKDKYDFLNPNSIKNKIYNSYINNLAGEIRKISDLDRIKVQPNWIDTQDFKNYCDERNYYGVFTKEENSIIGIDKILYLIKEINFDVEDFIVYLNNYRATRNTKINTLVMLANKYRFSFNNVIKELVLDAYLFEIKGNVQQTKYILQENIANDSFYKELEKKVNDINDLKYFLKDLGFVCFQSENIASYQDMNDILTKNELEHLLSNKTLDNTDAPEILASKSINSKKWRSVEKNVQQILESFDDVKSVQDVSNNNVGYDLLVEYISGEKKFVEVKSVNRLGDEFSMTSNEYATANDDAFKKNYALAVVEQNENEINMMIIDYDNFKNISFTKRIVKYEWTTTSSYSGKYFTFPLDN